MELRWKCFEPHKFNVTVKRSNLFDRLILGEETFEKTARHKPILQYKENDEWIDVPEVIFPFPVPEDFPDVIEEL